MALLLATANKFRVEMASLEIVAKNVAETPEARFKQKALGKYTTGKTLNNAGNAEGCNNKEV